MNARRRVMAAPVTGKITTSLEELRRPSELFFSRCDLEVEKGPDAGKRFSFGQQTIHVGTAPTSDVALQDGTVSRFHLKIDSKEGVFSLVDLGSRNGTWLGGFKVQAVELDREARIVIGQTTLRFTPRTDKASVRLPAQDRLGHLVGISTPMRQLYALIQRIAPSDAPVIVHGETGTGKEVVARTIHDLSLRKDGPFEVLDCTALPDNLAESELFGHQKGAFTGAERDRPGIFERAHGGTVFLDELGELKLELQPKLLRVLESGLVRRVGGDKPIKVDVRLVAATHRSLREMVNRGSFREDLYYRLAVCELEIPPLRERRQDIPILVSHFLARGAGEGRADLDPTVVRGFLQHDWPGNVRQLRNAVERAALLGPSSRGRPLPEPFDVLSTGVNATPGLAAGATNANGGAEGAATSVLAESLDDAKAAFEQRYLRELIRKHGKDLDAAAQVAGVHPKSLARLYRRYGLQRA